MMIALLPPLKWPWSFLPHLLQPQPVQCYGPVEHRITFAPVVECTSESALGSCTLGVSAYVREPFGGNVIMYRDIHHADLKTRCLSSLVHQIVLNEIGSKIWADIPLLQASLPATHQKQRLCQGHVALL